MTTPTLYGRVSGSFVPLGVQGPPGAPGPVGPQGPADGSVRYWNSAWGIVAIRRNSELATTSGGALQIAASTQGGVNFAEPYTFLEGRRYRFVFYCRAWGINGGAGVAATVRFIPYVDGADRQSNLNDPWVAKPASQWDTARAEFVMNCVAGGTGADLSPGYHTFQFVAVCDGSGTHYFWNTGSHFTIVDEGPVGMSIPVPPPTTTTAWIPLVTAWPQPHNIAYRLVNDEVMFRGSMNWNSTGGAANPMMTMPVGYRPATMFRGETQLASNADQYTPQGIPLGIGVQPSGTLSVGGLSATTGYIPFDCVRYSVTP